MAYDAKSKDRTLKYQATQKQVRFWERPETYAEYQDAAERAGQSVTAYIRQAIRERMERDGLRVRPHSDDAAAPAD